MRLRLAIAIGSMVGLVAACGGQPPSQSLNPAPIPTDPLPTTVVSTTPATDTPAEHVVRAWADALDAGRNDLAATYFARDVDVGGGIVLRTQTRILDWVSTFPCRLTVVSLVANNEFVTLEATSGGNRPTLACPTRAGGALTYQIRVHDQKIVALVAAT